MAKKFLLMFNVLLAISAYEATAGPASDKIAQREREPFRGYSKACGFPIFFANISTISLARIDARYGKIIVLDPFLTYPAQAAHRRFLIAHECAHHLLGHTSRKGLRERRGEKGVEDQELSADCRAAEMLLDAGLSADVRMMVDAFYRKGLVSPGSGYPSGVQRSTLIYHCMKSAHRRKIAAREASAAQK